MNPFAALGERLKARTDTEHEQAILRIVIFSLVLAALPWSHAEPLLAFGLAAALVLAIALFVGVCVWPAPSIARRVTGMLADAGAATFCMFLAGESGVSMIGFYLFITFGNGFRYGQAYLFACQALCVVGFSAVLLYAPYWEFHRVIGWCLLIVLIVLPVYVSTLLKRIQEARAHAEEARIETERALKECLERERRAG